MGESLESRLHKHQGHDPRDPARDYLEQKGVKYAMTESRPQTTPPQEMTLPQGITPPRQPGEIGGTEDRARWAKIIGIISIVLGAGGCFGAAWGFVVPKFMGAMAERVPPNQAAAFANVQAWGNWIVVNSALSLLIALLLVVAGASLVKRRRTGIRLARVWAVSKMLLAIVGAFVGLAMQQDQFQQMSQQNSPLPGAPFLDVMVFVGVVIGLLWSCTFPVFVLIWFSRGKVKAEYCQWS